MKKKILIYMRDVGGGGAERNIINIIRYLDKKKFKVSLLLFSKFNNQYIKMIPESIEIDYIIPSIKTKYAKLFYKTVILPLIIYKIIKKKPDIIFSTMHNNSLVLLLSRFFISKKIKVIIREATVNSKRNHINFIRKFLIKKLYNRASKIVAISKGVKKDLIKNFNINPRLIYMIYNSIDTDYIKKKSRKNLKFKGNEKIIISTGRLINDKDQKTLISAFSIINKKIPSKLLILGRGENKNNLIKWAFNEGVGDRVFFMGFKKNPFVYLRNSDLFIATSLVEGFPNSIIEAMACGVPVISTDCCSGPKEIIKNNQYGVLTKIKDYKSIAYYAIELLQNKKMYEHYKNSGYKRSLFFNKYRMIKKYERLFLT
ncbi:MAG: glycosyltransferase [Candidatus Muiribacteriota bacterium]